MDLGEYWQENKRFATGVGVGAVLFLIAFVLVGSFFDGDIASKRREIGKRRADLGQAMFTAADLADAQAENARLRAAVDALAEAADFVPRPAFALDPSGGAANTQYLRTLSTTREELGQRANRANLRLDPTLGMPSLSPTREAEIVRTMEALDVVEQVVGLAIDARLQHVDRIRLQLDPRLHAREGLGAVERTLVTFTMSGDSLALARLLTWTQRPREGRRLHLQELEVVPSRNKPDELKLELTVVIARLTAGEQTS